MTYSAASSFVVCSVARWGHTDASEFTCSRNEGDAESATARMLQTSDARGAVALLGKGNRMNKRQAKIDALSASAVVLFGLADSDFGDELCDENREKLLRAVNNIAQRLWERSMKLKERDG